MRFLARNCSAFGCINILILSLGLSACTQPLSRSEPNDLIYPGEVHFKNMRQLTHGGTNAEAYWSFDGKSLTFQHKGLALTVDPVDPTEPREGVRCDQIYTMNVDGKTNLRFISKNQGRTTCSYFLPKNDRILFASTYAKDIRCPAEPDKSRGYVWPIYNSYQLYTTATDGSDIRPMEPGAPRAYNAEATVCHDGSVVFTSDRDGDLDLYVGKIDSFGTMSEVRRVTHEIGYDGGAFFSQDCKKLVWRASRPRVGKERQEYEDLLSKHLVRPGALEIWVGNADGSHARQVTRVQAASFAPFFSPDGKSILFASNPRDPRGRHFDVYKIRTDGTGLERITFSDTFDSFPMFSPDGKRLAFSSNRRATQPHETNVFVTDWVDTPETVPAVDDPNATNRIAAVVTKFGADTAADRLHQFVREELVRIGFTRDPKGAFVYGDGCGKTRPVVLTAQTPSAGNLAVILEAAKILHELRGTRKACFTIDLDGTAWDKAKVVLGVNQALTMESNEVRVRTADTNIKSRLNRVLTGVCDEEMIHCRLTSGAPKGSLVFETVGSPPESNYTGAVQLAALLADTALSMGSK